MRSALVKSVEPISPRRQLQQEHLRQSSCHTWSSAFSRYRSKIGFWQPKHLGAFWFFWFTEGADDTVDVHRPVVVDLLLLLMMLLQALLEEAVLVPGPSYFVPLGREEEMANCSLDVILLVEWERRHQNGCHTSVSLALVENGVSNGTLVGAGYRDSEMVGWWEKEETRRTRHMANWKCAK